MATLPTEAREFIQMAQWASVGDKATPTDENITVSSGFDASYSTVGGNNPPRELWNWAWAAIQGALKTIAAGPITWQSSIDFPHPSLCTGSDGAIYASVKSSGPATADAEDPTLDADDSTWKLLLPNASTSVRGMALKASNSDATTGTDTDKFITSKQLKDAVDDVDVSVSAASKTARGIIEIATSGSSSDEAETGTDDVRAMTPLASRRAGDARYAMGSHTHPAPSIADASETQKGLVEYATESEMTGNATRVATPQRIRNLGDGRWSPTSHTHTYPNASTTQRGDVELLTNDEAKTGTDTERAMTAAAFRAAADARYAQKGGSPLTITVSPTGWATRTSGQLYTILNTGGIASASVGASWAVSGELTTAQGAVITITPGPWIALYQSGSPEPLNLQHGEFYPFQIRKESSTTYRVYMLPHSNGERGSVGAFVHTVLLTSGSSSVLGQGKSFCGNLYVTLL